MTTWVLLWLIVALVAIVGEVMSTGLFLASVAVAAALTAVTAIILPAALQAVVFAVLSGAGIAFIRPMLVGTFGLQHRNELTGPVSNSALSGRRALVTEDVEAGSGQIRIGQGEFWTARPFDDEAHYPRGTKVEIIYVDGLTAYVSAVPSAGAIETPKVIDARNSEPDAEEQKGTTTWTTS